MDDFVRKILKDYDKLLEENSLDNKTAKALRAKYTREIAEAEKEEKEKRYQLSKQAYCGSFGFGPHWVETPFSWLSDERDRLKAVKEFEKRNKVRVQDLKPLPEYYYRSPFE
jgi:hypothetical protein